MPATETDRRLLASILLKEDEELTAEVLEAAVRALRRIHLRRRQEDVQQELKKPGLAADRDRLRRIAHANWSESAAPCAIPASRKTALKNAGNEENRLKQKGRRNHLSI